MFIANCIAAFCNDSLSVANEVTPTVADSVHSQTNAVADSVNSAVATTADSLNNVVVADSADAYVMSNSDNVAAPSKQRRSRKRAGEEYWMPDPKKAMWLSLLLPGAGQIYNRSYWKLPIVYGAFMGCGYAVSMMQNRYSGYKSAYLDLYNYIEAGVDVTSIT
ncbi:MAG: hypothetical protein J6S93_10530, partial [Paludibacteraceae bacterium]|nr:hypothetical protein [Paludibacteraceae bacterium]